MSNNSTAASNVIPFSFGRQQVRTLMIDDQPWFAAQDVLDALEYADTYKPSRAVSHVPSQWKGVQRLHTLGGTQQIMMISEQGLYFVLGRSDKPKALPFQMWLAGDVLPSIRKQGRYEDDNGQMGTLIGETIGTNGFNMLGALIKGKVVSLPPAHHRKATAKIWSQTHAAFGVRSAADIPASQLDAARNFVAAYVLEGEWLGRATAPAGTIVSKGEMLWINSLIVNAEELSRLVVRHGICDHLREVGSPIASSMTGRTLETQMSCNQVRDSLGAALEAASAWASRVCDAPIKRLA